MLRRSLASALLLFTGVSPAVAIMPFPEVVSSQDVDILAFQEMLESGTADDIIQILVRRTFPDDDSGNAMWKGKGIAMLTTPVRGLVWLRDSERVVLTPNAIRETLSLKKIMGITSGEEFPSLPESIRRGVRGYLSSLPGYVEAAGENQREITLDFHAYPELQFRRTLDELSV